jgi:hypothetical protein
MTEGLGGGGSSINGVSLAEIIAGDTEGIEGQLAIG